MSRSVNIECPCDGDLYQALASHYARNPECVFCLRESNKCLGRDGWAFMALAAAEVARERGENAQR